MASQLQLTLTGLEARVTERTNALETSFEVSRRLSTIVDEEELVATVVDQVHSALNYYHVHIYLLNKHGNMLMLAGGSGTAGQTMLNQGHSIEVGIGLVGVAAETNSPILVSDVAQDPTWLANPLLPETKAEAAIPIAIGDELLGVLDVQQDTVNGLGPEDVELLQSMTIQIAIALGNARNFAMSQEKVKNEAMINTISQRIDGADSVAEVMQLTVRELGRALGSEKAAIRLIGSD